MFMRRCPSVFAASRQVRRWRKLYRLIVRLRSVGCAGSTRTMTASPWEGGRIFRGCGRCMTPSASSDKPAGRDKASISYGCRPGVLAKRARKDIASGRCIRLRTPRRSSGFRPAARLARGTPDPAAPFGSATNTRSARYRLHGPALGGAYASTSNSSSISMIACGISSSNMRSQKTDLVYVLK